MKNTGLNQAGFAIGEGQDPAEFYFATVWSAIRSGWREGYVLQGPAQLSIPGVRRKPYETEIRTARVVDIEPENADRIEAVIEERAELPV
jgi:hypothetical protein